MISLQEQLQPLLRQFSKATGRGNLIQAHDIMRRVIQRMAETIDRACDCKSEESIDLPVQALPIKRPRGRPPKRRD